MSSCQCFDTVKQAVGSTVVEHRSSGGELSLSCARPKYGCESWTLGKNEETRLDAFERKG